MLSYKTMGSAPAIMGLLAGMLLLEVGASARDFMDPKPTSEETLIVERCVVQAPTDRDKRNCIGIVSNACRETEDGSTTLGNNACLSHEYGGLDVLLNRYYGDAMRLFDPDGQTRLKQAQLTWLRFRDQDCAWPYDVYRGGTLAGTLSAECWMTQTALRALELNDMVERLKEK